eukprot:3648199-Pyramimonas_sp.AAC.1
MPWQPQQDLRGLVANAGRTLANGGGPSGSRQPTKVGRRRATTPRTFQMLGDIATSPSSTRLWLAAS